MNTPNHDKQIMAGLLLDKDKSSIPEAISVVADNVKRLQEAEYNNYLLIKLLCAITKLSLGEIKIPKAIMDSISPSDEIKVEKDERTGNILVTLKGFGGIIKG